MEVQGGTGSLGLGIRLVQIGELMILRTQIVFVNMFYLMTVELSFSSRVMIGLVVKDQRRMVDSCIIINDGLCLGKGLRVIIILLKTQILGLAGIVVRRVHRKGSNLF